MITDETHHALAPRGLALGAVIHRVALVSRGRSPIPGPAALAPQAPVNRSPGRPPIVGDPAAPTRPGHRPADRARSGAGSVRIRRERAAGLERQVPDGR